MKINLIFLCLFFLFFNNLCAYNSANLASVQALDLKLRTTNPTETERDFQNFDLSNADMTGLFLSGAYLQNANLNGAILTGTDLGGANLTDANLSNASLIVTNLGGAELGGANLSSADLSGAYLIGSNLQNANLTSITMWGADLTGANLGNANLSNSVLNYSYFLGTNLKDANLTGVDLTNVLLTGAYFGGSSLVTSRNLLKDLKFLEKILKEKALNKKDRESFMKKILISILRNKNTDIESFRKAASKLAYILANEACQYLEKETENIETPIATSSGIKLKNDIILVPILRSAIALLPAFLEFYPQAKVGFVGLKRDEQTAIAHLYYKNFPEVKVTDDVILLDPMIATGGSGCDAIKLLKEDGIKEEKIIFVSVISAKQGIEKIKKEFSKVRIVCAQYDQELNKDSYIIPGLGDFGDRYFGTL
ncbi:uracil phosphoribosyltransferase [Candidatus Babeliales bacterium]|nr:uracil phosphoribosyltransferase [Candidatus Babeliales bacterium]